MVKIRTPKPEQGEWKENLRRARAHRHRHAMMLVIAGLTSCSCPRGEGERIMSGCVQEEEEEEEEEEKKFKNFGKERRKTNEFEPSSATSSEGARPPATASKQERAKLIQTRKKRKTHKRPHSSRERKRACSVKQACERLVTKQPNEREGEAVAPAVIACRSSAKAAAAGAISANAPPGPL